MEGEVFANRRGEQHHAVQHDGGDRQTREQITPADPRLNRGQPARPHVMDHRHQAPGNRNQRGEPQVHRQHAERQFEPECPGIVVPDRLIASRRRPEHDRQEPGSPPWSRAGRAKDRRPRPARIATTRTIRRAGSAGTRRRLAGGHPARSTPQAAARVWRFAAAPGVGDRADRRGLASPHCRVSGPASGLGDGPRRDRRPLVLGHGLTSPGLDMGAVPRVWLDSANAGSPSSVKAAAIRASVDCRPSNSIDSNSGGEIRLPVTAARTGPKASRGFRPSLSTSAVRNADSTAAVIEVVEGS